MIELPQIRALVPFCCQHSASVTWGEFCFFPPVCDSTFAPLLLPPPPHNDPSHIAQGKNSSLMLICWFYRLEKSTRQYSFIIIIIIVVTNRQLGKWTALKEREQNVDSRHPQRLFFSHLEISKRLRCPRLHFEVSHQKRTMTSEAFFVFDICASIS